MIFWKADISDQGIFDDSTKADIPTHMYYISLKYLYALYVICRAINNYKKNIYIKIDTNFFF